MRYPYGFQLKPLIAVEKMKPTPISYFVGLLLTALCFNSTQAQTFGTKASAIWISSCSQNNFYNINDNITTIT